MFQEGRTNIYDDEHEGQLSMMLDKTVRCIHALLKDDCHLTITGMQREMAAHFSHQVSKTTIVQVLQ